MAKNILLRNKTSRTLLLTSIRDTSNKPVKLSGEGTEGDVAECLDDVLTNADVMKFQSVGWLVVQSATEAPAAPVVLSVPETPAAEPVAEPVAEDPPVIDTVSVVLETAVEVNESAPVVDEPPAPKKGRRGR